MKNARCLQRSSRIFCALALIVFSMPALGRAQCGIDNMVFILVHHLWRTSFNTVEALGGSQAYGPYEGDWYTTTNETERLNGNWIASGSDAGWTASGVEIEASPSSVGTGLYSHTTRHEFECENYYDVQWSGDSLAVNQPTVGNLPYNNDLWYFGPGSPSAVPTLGGQYFYQYANLTFNKNCGGGDTCSGTPTWSESDPSGYISLSCTNCSNTTLQSSGVGNCTDASSISVSLNGWAIGPINILVNSPRRFGTTIITSTAELPSGSADPGYETTKQYQIEDRCTPYDYVQSAPFHESFGSFSNHSSVTSGWPNPSAEGTSAYNCGDYTICDYIYAHDNGANPQWSPDPEFNDPAIRFTILKQATQSWYVGSSTPNSSNGVLVRAGSIYYYQDHGNAQ